MQHTTRWPDQCRAAQRLQTKFGPDTAMGYLVAEKFMAFLRLAQRKPELADEAVSFATEVRAIFPPDALRAFIGSLRSRRRGRPVVNGDVLGWKDNALAAQAESLLLRG